MKEMKEDRNDRFGLLVIFLFIFRSIRRGQIIGKLRSTFWNKIKSSAKNTEKISFFQ